MENIADQNQTRIKWNQDLYGWQKLEGNFFSSNDYMTINKNIQLVKIDPEFARKETFVASKIYFFGDFSLYQCDTPSQIRKNIPMRFLYSKKYGKFFELMGTNAPIYEMMDFISGNKAVHAETFENGIETWLNEHWFSYMVVFFDNVRGKHGRFELIRTYDELMDRTLNYQQYLARHHRQSDQASDIDETHRKNYHRLIADKIRKNKTPITTTESSIKIENILLFFKEVLFTTSLIFEKSSEKFGQVSLADEKMVDYYSLLEEDEKKDVQNIDTLSWLPEAELSE